MSKSHQILKKNDGFTLAELLIVVAIIAVLVAISIPIFTSQLEKSRESTDLANVRAAYAEVMTAALSEDIVSPYYDASAKKWSIIVNLKQKKDGWSIKTPITIGSVTSGTDGDTNSENTWLNLVKGNGTCEVVYQESTGAVFIWNGSIGGGSGNPAGGNGSPADGDETPPADENPDSGENSPPNFLDLFDSTEYPDTSGDFYAVYGNVYKYDGGLYVYRDTTGNLYIDGNPNNSSPKGSWYVNRFIPLSPDAKVYKPTDLNSNNQIPSVNRGSLYQDSTGLYIMETQSEQAINQTPPPNTNWVKINTK